MLVALKGWYLHFITLVFICVNCGVGFTYLEDGSCLDINECDFDNGQCSDHCKNTQGSCQRVVIV